MSTPVMAFTQYMKWMLVGFWMIWVTTLFVSRIFIFHEAYITHAAKVVDEQWLAQQCSKPEFYSNIRQHTDLCEAVYANSRSSAFLVALNAMAVNTYVCGNRPCVEVLQSVFVKMGWQTIGVVIILFLFAPNVLVLLYKTMCGRSLNTYECAMVQQNERYGLDSYAPYFQVRPCSRSLSTRAKDTRYELTCVF
jgi:hypothetical protein